MLIQGGGEDLIISQHIYGSENDFFPAFHVLLLCSQVLPVPEVRCIARKKGMNQELSKLDVGA